MTRYVSLLLVELLLVVPTMGQNFDRSSERKDAKKTDVLQQMQAAEKASSALGQSQGIALEAPVDPAVYFVGPSDLITVNIWISPPQSYPLTVTPEGTLLIPMVGEVKVADLTLADAKKLIIGEVRKKYLLADITATLTKPRPIIVSVTGHVLNPGLYTLSAVDRANKAIEEANKISRLQSEEDLRDVTESMSRRNVVVTHRDGTQQRVDLPKYYATREEKLNPYLREGDIVVVPMKEETKNSIAIYGQVNTNGRFEFVEGDSLMDAIKLANGLTSRAMADRVVFSRMNADGSVLANRSINLDDVRAGREPNFPLMPGDRIIVNAKPELREDFNVDVKGELVYPGTYPITRNSTKLSEVVRQAGGFTEFAALNGAQVIRHRERRRLEDTDGLLNMRGIAGTEDTSGTSVESALRETGEMVTVDFVKLFVQGDSTQDITVQPEDAIIVPRKSHSVYVFGQVRSPGHILIAEGKSAGYYVDRCGGFTDHAAKGGVKVIKAGSRQWLSPGETEVEDGDQIWVPGDIDRPFSYYMNVASQTASVLSVVIGVIILIVQVSK
jgi:protein involved in polysaccharide export with SLBB domain